MPHEQQRLSRSKVLFFGAAATVLVIFVLNLSNAPADMSAGPHIAAGVHQPTVSSFSERSVVQSPFAAVTCLSADCSTTGDEEISKQSVDELPPQTAIFSYLDKIQEGDFGALSASVQVLERCLSTHRVRILTDKAFGIEVPAEVTECDAAVFSELAAAVDVAIQKGFSSSAAPSSASKVAMLSWLFNKAQLDDVGRELENLPRLQPDVNGVVTFADLPPPKRGSPSWKSLAVFVEKHGKSDPDVLKLADAIDELGRDTSSTTSHTAH